MQKRRKLKTLERQQVYNKFKGHCAYCGCEIEFKDMQVDHIEPLELGGADELYNMYPACRSCNHYKHTLTIEKFRKALECMPNVLMRDNVTFRNAMRYELIKPYNSKVVFFFEKERKKNDP